MTAQTLTADAVLKRPTTPVQRLQRTLHAHPWISPAVVLVAAYVVFSLLNERFAQPGIQSLLIQQTAVVAALAIGQTLIILTAGIDLSVGAIAILAMMVSAKAAAENGLSGPAALALGLVVGAGAGLLNGVLVTRLSLPPFIVTLGTLSMFTALTLIYTRGTSIQGSVLPDLLNWTGNSFAVGEFRITVGVLLVLGLYAGVGYALSQTAWGQHVYAVGDDPEAARLSGVSARRVLLSVYVVAGVIYAVAAWVLIGRAGAASPNALSDANLASITAVVIGGTSLFGGRGTLIGTLLGALIVQSFTLGLGLARVDEHYRLLAVGALVILAVAADQWIRKARA
ncbi:ABC transporter permease [Nocardioides speluncae]|uniref:ABC transporter permease n=1 Tax=Nocardioides speluncae TaxID=2670337 RepID=UPI000D69E81C|nr:ABC transporter permease [Nocardioides speluncae]